MGKNNSVINSILSKISDPLVTQKVIDSTTPFDSIGSQGLWKASLDQAIEKYIHPSLTVYIEHNQWSTAILDKISLNNSIMTSEGIQDNLEKMFDEWYWSLAQKTISFKPLAEALASAPSAARTTRNIRIYYVTAITKEVWQRALLTPLSQRTVYKEWPECNGLAVITQAGEYTSINVTPYSSGEENIPFEKLDEMTANSKENSKYVDTRFLRAYGPVNIWFDYILDVPIYNYNGTLSPDKVIHIVSMAPRHLVEKHCKELQYPVDKNLPVYGDTSNAMLGNMSRFGDNEVLLEKKQDFIFGTSLYPISYTKKQNIPQDTVIMMLRLVPVDPPKERKKSAGYFLRSLANGINYHRTSKG